jgi:hypothetical protein
MATEIRKHLLAYGSTFQEAFSQEMAVDLMALPEDLPFPTGLEIVPVENGEILQQWIHTASIGFEVPEAYEKVCMSFFLRRPGSTLS